MDEAVLRVEDLGKRFILHERGARLQALAGLSFSLRAGSIAALTGPSGAGKSTVLKCLWRTYLPSAGRLLYRDGDGATVDLATGTVQLRLGTRETFDFALLPPDDARVANRKPIAAAAAANDTRPSHHDHD